MPKITVDKLNLMEPKQVTGLVGMSIQQIYSVLENTPYKAIISEVKENEFNFLSLEKALTRNFISTYEQIRKLSPKDVSLLLSALLMKFEANCVKALLRAKEAELSVKEAMKYIIPLENFGDAKCRSILENSENINDVIDSLSDTEYGAVLEKVFTVYMKEKVFYLLEVAIDRHVYQKIWKATGKFRGLDRKIARTIIGLEIDSINVKTILRCKAIGIKPNQIEQYLIFVSNVLNKKELRDAMRCSDLRSTIDSLVITTKNARARDHYYVFRDLQDVHVTSLTTVETVLDRGLVETNLRIMKRYTPFFNIGLLLAFLNLKWFEIKNLRAIFRGAEAGIAPDRVKKLLVIPR